MTVVATDGYDFACDSVVSEDSSVDPATVFDKAVEVTAARAKRIGLKGRGRAVVGCAGNASNCYAFLTWCKDGRRKKPDLGNEFEAIALREDGSLWYMDENWVWFPFGAPNAIGSGAPSALGAMYAGAQPLKAARIACKLAKDCGEPVKVIKLRPRRD